MDQKRYIYCMELVLHNRLTGRECHNMKWEILMMLYILYVSIIRYDYTICPFENVTHKRILGGKPTLLGVWGEWTTLEVGWLVLSVWIVIL